MTITHAKPLELVLASTDKGDQGTISIEGDNARVGREKKKPLETISHGGLTLKGPPRHVSFESDRNHRLNHMTAVFRHWLREGYVVGFSGHISYRDP